MKYLKTVYELLTRQVWDIDGMFLYLIEYHTSR